MRNKSLVLIAFVLVFSLAICALVACDEATLDEIVSESGAMVEGGSFPEGSSFVATLVAETSDEGKEALEAIKGQEYNVFKPVYILDISVVKDNAKVQPNGKVKVTIPVTAAYASYRAVLHVKDNGTVERLSATYADGKISFETDSFSIFVLVEPVVTNEHTHTFSKEWSQSETHHWHAATCGHTDLKDSNAAHYYDENGGWSTEKPATETEEGVKVRVCIGCKYEDRQPIPKLDHTHTFSNEWTSDGTNHWHAATCSHTTEKSGEAACSGGNATCTKRAVCSVCGNEYGELLDHDFVAQVRAEDYLAAAATCQSPAKYYYSCYDCGAKGTKTFDDPYRKLGSCTYNEAEVCTVCATPAADWFTFALRADGESYKVTGTQSPNGRRTEYLVVPSTYKDKPVVEIADQAFYFSTLNPKHLVLPDSIQILGDSVLYPYIETITIGKGLKTIDDFSFGNGNGGCENLRQITISPDNPYFKMVDGVMYSKDGKTLVKYPAKLEGTQFTIDNKVEKIWSCAFEATQNLNKVVIPDNVTAMMHHAFCNSKITAIDIGLGIETIPEYAFASCNIVNAKLEGNIKTIEYRAFYYSAVKTITFGAKVTSIGDQAFQGSWYISAIDIPDNVKTLGTYAFAETASVTRIVIGSGIDNIPDSAFESSASSSTNPTITIGGNVKTIGKKAFSGAKISSITIPASVTTIGDGAFGMCAKLTEIVIPNTVKSIGEACFQDCKLLAEVTLSNQLTEIPNNAFYRCEMLTSITIPNSVKTIGDGAFATCKKLDTIEFGTGLTKIGKQAFSYCLALTSMTIPDGVEELDHYLFDGCEALKTVVLPTSINKISGFTFKNCSALESVTFKGTEPKVMYFAFSGIYTYTFDSAPKTISMLSNQELKYSNTYYLYSLAAYNEDHPYNKITEDTKIIKWEERETA